ncbi:MAG: phosphoenolpyruvate-utilizing N-terminal domain-containing protein, partial [Pseudoxanthomonas sp.]
MRLQLSGHGASRGSALGRARVRLPHALEVVEKRIPANLVEKELRRLRDAVDSTRGEMQ